MKNYVSNEDKSAKMFDSGFMEFFTHIHPALPLVIYVPVVLYSLYVTHVEMNASSRFFLFAGGVFIWTLTEYALHRHVFHLIPENIWGKRLHFIMHGVHHDYPNDSRRLVMAPAISIPLSIFFFFLFKTVCGPRYVFPFFAGFITGYLLYDMTHYAIHHLAMKNRLCNYLRKHHFRHHYSDSDVNFGVSSPMWDVVFGTLNDERKENSEPAILDVDSRVKQS
jgi:sterol desaturase/sphingolipid hydroxylase (fatty acid hydroxylase superfamily)